MSGGPPHHPHSRQVPATNTAWNHLQVPNYFPRQPQLAHMSNEHSLIHQPTWHTPTTTEAMKIHPHAHMLSEMLKNEQLFARDCVDLSLTRNGNQNGEISLTPTPISLSVRDTNKINSLPASALEVQAVEPSKCTSPGFKSTSPSVKSASPSLQAVSPSPKSASPGRKTTSSGFKVDSLGLKSLSPGLKPASPALMPASSVGKSASPALVCTVPGSTTTSLISANPSPISTNPILPAGLAVKSASSVLKSVSPAKPASPGLKCASLATSTQVLPLAASTEGVKTQKRSNIRVDSILERLNPTPAGKFLNVQENKEKPPVEKPKDEEKIEKAPAEQPVSVIVQPAGSFDDNSNSGSILNIPTSTTVRDDDTVSTYSNEDSLDSNKSRRKRKPSKTIRVSKDEEKEAATTPLGYVECFPKEMQIEPENDPVTIVGQMLEEGKVTERSSDDLDTLLSAKTRRKTSSESETIDNIAAMVQEGLKEKKIKIAEKPVELLEAKNKPISVSVIKTKENLADTLSDDFSKSFPNIVTPAQKKASNTHFVEVENKLEEMFAGIEDSSDPLKTDALEPDDTKLDDPLLKLDDPIPSTSLETATVTSSTEIKKKIPSPKKTKRKAPMSRRNSDSASLESTPKKKKISRKFKAEMKVKGKTKIKKSFGEKQTSAKVESVKDVYAYDSGSNASSGKSKGPFIQIKGPRDSPLSVNVVNTPSNDEDGDRKVNKTRKFHDDTEYRHKVRSKGLHCSTLSNKYDAQTRDATWICAFCKRGPHASELTGPSSNRDVVPAGDLFGPYFITTQCPEFERRLDDPYDKQFRSKKVGRVLDGSSSLAIRISGKKSKRKYSDVERSSESDSDIYLGITETGNEMYEIWAHEDCIVWSPGIYLVGPKIVGLEEAVWTSCNVLCLSCNLKGANICCLKRGCLSIMHLCCARSAGWQFVESDFKAYCLEHALP